MSDLARVLAFAYQRKGARTMPRLDLHMLLSMDLRWFAPEESKKIVARALDAGLLAAEGDVLRVAFDPASVPVPLNFRPQARALLEEPLVELPAASKPGPPPVRDEEAAAERAKRGGLISLDVARLVVARRRGEDIAARLAEAESSVLKP